MEKNIQNKKGNRKETKVKMEEAWVDENGPGLSSRRKTWAGRKKKIEGKGKETRKWTERKKDNGEG